MTRMLKRITLLSLLILCLNLVGCSSVANSNSLRNRNFDYARVNVENLSAPLETPKGLSTPNFSPKFNIPPGQNSYSPDAIFKSTPPDFSQVYEIPEVAVKPKI